MKHKQVTTKTKENYIEFTNSEGTVVQLRGMPPLIPQQIMSSVKKPTKPQYSVTTAAGDEEWFDHDESTLRTDEEKAAWQKYITDASEAENKITERLLKAILMESVTIIDMKAVENWKKRQKMIGIDLPEDQEECIQLYKETQVIRNREEMEEIMDLVLELTGVSKEDIDSVKDSFQD